MTFFTWMFEILPTIEGRSLQASQNPKPGDHRHERSQVQQRKHFSVWRYGLLNFPTFIKIYKFFLFSYFFESSCLTWKFPLCAPPVTVAGLWRVRPMLCDKKWANTIDISKGLCCNFHPFLHVSSLENTLFPRIFEEKSFDVWKKQS